MNVKLLTRLKPKSTHLSAELSPNVPLAIKKNHPVFKPLTPDLLFCPVCQPSTPSPPVLTILTLLREVEGTFCCSSHQDSCGKTLLTVTFPGPVVCVMACAPSSTRDLYLNVLKIKSKSDFTCNPFLLQRSQAVRAHLPLGILKYQTEHLIASEL